MILSVTELKTKFAGDALLSIAPGDTAAGTKAMRVELVYAVVSVAAATKVAAVRVETGV